MVARADRRSARAGRIRAQHQSRVDLSLHLPPAPAPGEAAPLPATGQGDPRTGDSGIPCGGRHHAKVKRSSNRMASWALAMTHSRGGIFHSFAARFNTRNRSFKALSSVGKCPLVLTARRSLAFKLSMEFVV